MNVVHAYHVRFILFFKYAVAIVYLEKTKHYSSKGVKRENSFTQRS